MKLTTCIDLICRALLDEEHLDEQEYGEDPDPETYGMALAMLWGAKELAVQDKAYAADLANRLYMGMGQPHADACGIADLCGDVPSLSDLLVRFVPDGSADACPSRATAEEGTPDTGGEAETDHDQSDGRVMDESRRLHTHAVLAIRAIESTLHQLWEWAGYGNRYLKYLGGNAVIDTDIRP